MGTRQVVKTDNKKQRLNVLPVLRSKFLLATRALRTPMRRWLSAPTWCCELGALAAGFSAAALSQSALSWCIQPKITCAHPCCAYTWCCITSNACGVTFPHMATSPFPPQRAMCAHRHHLTRWSGNNDERNAAHCPELSNYTWCWAACLQKLGFMTQRLCLTQACKFFLVCR